MEKTMDIRKIYGSVLTRMVDFQLRLQGETLIQAARGAHTALVLDKDMTLTDNFSPRLNALNRFLMQEGETLVLGPDTITQCEGSLSRLIDSMGADRERLLPFYSMVNDLDTRNEIYYPLINPDIPQILDHANANGFRPIALATGNPQTTTVGQLRYLIKLPEAVFAFSREFDGLQSFTGSSSALIYPWKHILCNRLHELLGIPIVLVDDDRRQRSEINQAQSPHVRSIAPEWDRLLPILQVGRSN